ncbi:MAG: hypothetical protein A7316_04335 [Candidatus Altiarchaeales archaeon WOR_SM1_86-2]|nr:MAG: hypothetical protein A7316_04335 [Candidatus Altiarchaeales archaeon WOR_SM1_86-2]
MNLLFYLSGEHLTLPKSEVIGVLEGEGIDYGMEYEKGRLLILDADCEETGFLRRLAMTRSVSEFIAHGDDLEGLASQVQACDKISEFKTFAVRCVCFDDGDSMAVEKELGGRIKEISGLGVDLTAPDVTVQCFSGAEYFVGIKIDVSRENFEGRKPQHRPYFHPTSMHPKIARVLVNLARVKAGDRILDPFCGTGGILIEAGLMGIDAVGLDIDERMVSGAKKNLEFYGISGDAGVGNALEIDKKFQQMDAVVTDLPYGRSSFIPDPDLKRFCSKFIVSAYRVLKKGACLVLVLPIEYEPDFSGFEIVERHDLYIHKTLTRRIRVLRKV